MVSCIASAEEEIHVVILCTSDLHGDIWGYSYEDDKETGHTGMARLHTYINQVRKENPIVFLIDGGDAIQGTLMTDAIANKDPDSEHPVITAMNEMEYDSMTLGNHEFNWGITTMKKILSQARFPVLGANVLDQDGNYVTGAGWTILERGGVRLAVIGVCTPDVPWWDADKEGISDTTFEAGYAAVQKAIEEIGDRADILFVSAHMGEFPEFDEDGGSDSGGKILEVNPEADLLQVGHMHISVNKAIGRTPVFGVRNQGREIARVDLTLDQDRKIRDVSTELVDMAGYEPCEELRKNPCVKNLHAQTLSYVWGDEGEDDRTGEPIGTATARFQPENEIFGLPEGMLQDTAVIDLILKVQLLNSGADVSSCSLFKDTSDLPAGNLFYRDIFNIYKYDNTLYTMNVTGKELKAYMEWAAKGYNQWKPGDINISFDPDIPTYCLDLFGGVDYEVNLSKPKGERIENVMFRGEPLRDDQVLKLAVNNYRYSSAIKVENLAGGKRDWESSNPVREMIVDFFLENSPVEPEVDHNWKITGVDLSRDDPRRAEIIGWINEKLLETPYNRSYNLDDYDALAAQAKAGKDAGVTRKEHISH